MGQPITTNPLLISLINMTIVFAVLYGLSLIVSLIQKLDPTRKKKLAKESIEISQATTAVTTTATVQEDSDDERLIVFTAAIAAYGCPNAKIVAIRPVSGSGWSQAARMEAVCSWIPRGR